MKNILRTALALAVSGVLAASPKPDETVAERARIGAERSRAEAQFATQEKACYAKFAVNDCLGEARARRREVLADLRRQEISLNDAERRRRSAERLREIDERSSAQNQEQAATRRAQAASEQRQREERAADKAARAASAAARPPKPAQKGHEKKAPMPASEAAENAQRHEKRVDEVRERKERVERRQAERNKPPAKPLPVPP